MDEQLPERRVRVSTAERKKRLTVGGASVPAAIVACWIINEYIVGKDMPQEVAMSVGAMVGSIMSILSLCFNDLRGLFLGRFRNHRSEE